MKPDATRVLETTLASLVGEIAPVVTPAYRQSSIGVYAMLLTGVREEFDRAAARRVQENAALRVLFGSAAPLVADDGLHDRLDAAANGSDASLLVPDLEAANQGLRSLLIELHQHVESLDGPAARTLEESIWSELREQTERRRLSLAPF